ncbi:MAG: hypothetical protein AB7O73_12255 [Bacteroidia bacterium]
MQLETATTEFSIIEGNILFLKFKDNDIEIDLEEAKLHQQIAEKLTNSKKMLVLVDARDSMHMLTKEASEFIAAVDVKIAEAIVVKELHQRLLATFYLKFVQVKSKHPIKVFTDIEKAKSWLISLQ